jgi:glycolate oxidase
MALKNREAHRALEDVVGPDNISEHPAVLDSYAYQWGAELFTNTPFLPRAGAVVLPGNAQEVQTIVRVCNKYNIRYKAFSTGWGFYSGLGLDDTAIQMDLRRMNRIIEINDKCMYAVVEPYVTSSQLQAELMKRGFNLNIIGAGSNATAFPVAAHQGLGHTSLSTSYGPRNLLGVEWVLPDGDMIKLGSVGSGAGWFCGDGPGPSLRGVLRGPQTVMGGLGVFTKAATKIYPWPGPAKPEIEGTSPYYHFKERPKNMDLHYVVFPSWELFIDAIIEIAQAEICFAQTRLAPPMLAQGLSGNNDEGAELLVKLNEQIKDRPGFCSIIFGNSDSEFKYREKVFRQIVAEKEGSFIDYFENDDIKREYIWTITRSTIAIREVFRGTGRFLGSIGDSSMFLTSFKMMLAGMPLKRQFQEKGLVRGDEGLDCIWGTPIEFGHNGHAESLVQVHPSGDAWKAVMEYSARCEDMAIEEKYPAPVTVWGDTAHDKWGPHLCNYHLWLRKFKKAFDPNGVSEHAMYISAKGQE